VMVAAQRTVAALAHSLALDRSRVRAFHDRGQKVAIFDRFWPRSWFWPAGRRSCVSLSLAPRIMAALTDIALELGNNLNSLFSRHFAAPRP
jgi:hypothetical protein